MWGPAVGTPPIHGKSREPPWAAEQEATPTPRVPRHLTLHPFKGPRALGEARVGVMRSRWLGAPASDDRGGPPKVGRGACLGQLRGGRDHQGGLGDQNRRPPPQALLPAVLQWPPQEEEGPFPHSLASWSSLPQAPPAPPNSIPAFPALSGHLWNPDVEAK